MKRKGKQKLSEFEILTVEKTDLKFFSGHSRKGLIAVWIVVGFVEVVGLLEVVGLVVGEVAGGAGRPGQV